MITKHTQKAAMTTTTKATVAMTTITTKIRKKFDQSSHQDKQ